MNMKSMKLTFLMMMLFTVLSGTAQKVFIDDVYFSSGEKDKKQQTAEKVPQSKKNVDTSASASTYRVGHENESVTTLNQERDVDEYNRRYTSVEDSEYVEPETVDVETSERRSDTEYTERIVRYHSPSKITIAGADQVNLYLSDGYYAYGYDTNYLDNNTHVNVNINMGYGGWYDPWYTGGWYGGWYSGWYDPWYYSPARYWGYYNPYW